MLNQHFFAVFRTPTCRFLKYSSQRNRHNNYKADWTLHSVGVRWKQYDVLHISLISRKMGRFGHQSLSRCSSPSHRMILDETNHSHENPTDWKTRRWLPRSVNGRKRCFGKWVERVCGCVFRKNHGSST